MSTQPASGRMSLRTLLVVGLLLAAAVAGVLSFYASSEPDGLERVATDNSLSPEEAPHPMADSPLADYGVRGVDDPRLSTGLAGIAGSLVVLALAGGLFLLIRRRSAPVDAAGATASASGVRGATGAGRDGVHGVGR